MDHFAENTTIAQRCGRDHLLILHIYTQKEMSCYIISACWSFTDAVHFLCNNIVYDIYFNLSYETGSAAAEESSLQKAL